LAGLGPDIEVIRAQMTVTPPDDGSVQVEHDGTRVTAVRWTSGGTPCSVSTPIASDRRLKELERLEIAAKGNQ
jgi:hypothetical protein